MLGKLIKNKRIEKKITLNSIAKQLMVSNAYISKFERGMEMPSISFVVDAAKLLDINYAIAFDAYKIDKTNAIDKKASKAKEQLNNLERDYYELARED